MKIYVKQLYDDKGNKIPIALPEKGSQVAAGHDIVATSDPKIVGEVNRNTTGEKEITGWKRIDYIEYETNLFIAPSSVSFHTLIHPRSSISKYNLVLANSIGLVDNDYRGMIMCRFKYIWQPEDLASVASWNPNMEKIYKKGDKIAQLVGEATVTLDWEFVDDLSQTQRGTGGFGSTDKPQSKSLAEVFAEEQAKIAALAEKVRAEDSILKAYEKSGGVKTPTPYSELIKQRQNL